MTHVFVIFNWFFPPERAPEAVRLDVTDRRRGSNHNYPPMGSDYLHHPDDGITGLPEFTGIPNPPMAKAPEFQGPRSAGNSWTNLQDKLAVWDPFARICIVLII